MGGLCIHLQSVSLRKLDMGDLAFQLVNFEQRYLQGYFELSETVDYGRASETLVSVLLKKSRIHAQNAISNFWSSI